MLKSVKIAKKFVSLPRILKKTLWKNRVTNRACELNEVNYVKNT